MVIFESICQIFICFVDILLVSGSAIFRVTTNQLSIS